MFKEITKDNWLLYAQQNYDNPIINKEVEFYDDIKRFKYLKRLFRKYKVTGNLKLRLVLNHIEYLYPHELNEIKEDKKIVESLKEL